jgi:hypothetical protein
MSPSCFIVWVKKKRLHTHPRLRPPPNNVNENDLSVVHALLESTVAQLRLIAIMVYGLDCFFTAPKSTFTPIANAAWHSQRRWRRRRQHPRADADLRIAGFDGQFHEE